MEAVQIERDSFETVSNDNAFRVSRDANTGKYAKENANTKDGRFRIWIGFVFSISLNPLFFRVFRVFRG